jgi:hypothetical protein
VSVGSQPRNHNNPSLCELLHFLPSVLSFPVLCRDPYLGFGVTICCAGTVAERSKISLNKWILAIYTRFTSIPLG